ncbi:hypothetical protein [Sphingomonas aerolata]|uniref:hypothetical protein n=1 Tax=Sphingomonas aerolata TaxID=185951 RepID=UPI002FE314F9
MSSKFPIRPAGLLLVGVLGIPGVAEAHVKWFCGPIDGSAPPLPVGQVVTLLFLELFAIFVGLVMLGAMLDTVATRVAGKLAVDPERAGVASDVIVRAGVAVYALCLWGNLAVVMWADPSSGSLLTPDLYGAGPALGYVQLATAVVVLIPRLSIFAAAALVGLYLMGVAKFGLFYMIDYLFFLGIAAHLALGSPIGSRLAISRYRVPILIGSLSLSLMWTAVEKFLFPQWTISILVSHPGITAGQAFSTVATIAGFVEFFLAFYLLAGREILGRVGAILLGIVFVAAMPEFGMLDIVGHIPVILILVIALVTGETPLQIMCRGSDSGMLISGWKVGRAYVATLAVLMLLYYGLHALSVWTLAKSGAGTF